jgi:hypothetical protein
MRHIFGDFILWGYRIARVKPAFGTDGGFGNGFIASHKDIFHGELYHDAACH